MGIDIKKILLDILKGNFDLDVLKKLSDNEWNDLIDLSYKQLVKSIVYYKFKEHDLENIIPANILTDLKNYYQSLTINNLLLKSELIKLLKEFNRMNIPVVILKGLHLSFLVYPQIGLRFMRDLDILVPINKVKEVIEITEKLDYKTDRVIDDTYLDFKYNHQLPQMIKNDNLVLEIHGGITKPQKNYSFNIEEVWANAVETELFKQKVYTLDDLGLLIHLSIHISYQDSFTLDLRHYYDIFFILKNKNIDFKELIIRINQFNLDKGVYLVFLIIERLFDYSLPNIIHDTFNKKNKNYEDFINTAIELMWMHDRNSEKYIEYKQKRLPEYYRGNFFDKVLLSLKKVFQPKSLILSKYKLPVNSKLVYFYYLVNLKDLLALYLPNALKSKKLDEIYSKQVSIDEWLYQK